MELFDLRLWSGFTGDRSQPAIINQVTIDSKRINGPHSLFVALKGNHHDGHDFVANSGAKYALVREGFSANGIALIHVPDPLKAFQEIAKAYREQFTCHVVALTGSYGKTMVKDLLQEMIASKKCVVASPESFNSQIGVPLSLFNINTQHEVALIEAAISHPNEMDALADMIQPESVILTYIGKKHLHTLGSLQKSASEFFKLIVSPPKKQWILLPDDPLVNELEGHFWSKHESGLPHVNLINKDSFHVHFPDGDTYEGHITSGHTYIQDLLNMAVKAAWLLGISSKKICDVLDGYTPEPMRTEIWQSSTGVTFINDAYCSDPQSVDRALGYLDLISHGRKTFIFGGLRGESVEYERIGKSIDQTNLDKLILVGENDYLSLASRKNVSHALTYDKAFEQVKQQLNHTDTVLIKGDKKVPLDKLTEAFQGSICTNQCIINLAAIESNITTIRHKLPKDTRIMVMVKAQAYGTDDILMAKWLERCGIDLLGVSYVDEAIALKRAGTKQSLFVLNAAPYEAAKVVEWEIEIGVSDKTLIDAIAQEATSKGKCVKVHLHVDTGMSRLGCRPEEALALAQHILTNSSLKLEGIMTHFASADNPEEDPFTHEQVDCFDDVIQQIEANGISIPWKHAANSSAVMRFQLPQYNMVRIGLAIYGLMKELRPALSLISRIVGINICKKGETISYGRSYTVTKDTQRIAVIPIGYYDGLHRNYSGKGQVIIRGKFAPMVGNICMDYMMVDVTDIPNVTVGDSVLIFGEDEYGHFISPEHLASQMDSITHELITCLGPRIQRIFIHDEKP